MQKYLLESCTAKINENSFLFNMNSHIYAKNYNCIFNGEIRIFQKIYVAYFQIANICLFYFIY